MVGRDDKFASGGALLGRMVACDDKFASGGALLERMGEVDGRWKMFKACGLCHRPQTQTKTWAHIQGPLPQKEDELIGAITGPTCSTYALLVRMGQACKFGHSSPGGWNCALLVLIHSVRAFRRTAFLVCPVCLLGFGRRVCVLARIRAWCKLMSFGRGNK